MDVGPQSLRERLLLAGKSDAPSPAAMERAMTAARLARATLPPSGTASMAWLGRGLVIATLAAGAALWMTRNSGYPKPPEDMAPRSASVSAVPAVQFPAPVVRPPAPAQPAPSPLPEVRAIPSSLPSPPAPTRRNVAAQLSSTARVEDSFSMELAMIERARTALAAGHPDAALGTLDDYEARFETPIFGDEADVLRIEARSALGDRALSAALARQFLATHPSSPLAQRVRSLGLAGSSRVVAPDSTR
jgi:hypothetical protein